MCRQSVIPAVGLIAFGTGLLAGCCIESCLTSFCVALAAVGGGLWLMRRR